MTLDSSSRRLQITTAMPDSAPHYLLFSDVTTAEPGLEQAGGEWRFVLEAVAGNERLEAACFEPHANHDRLALLAVVRGLEALDQPSKVTLVTSSRYVARGLRFGVPAWRDTRWQWERNGSLEPIRNSDFWQRVGRALEYHELHCRVWRLDLASERGGTQAHSVPRPHYQRRPTPAREGRRQAPVAAATLFQAWAGAVTRFARRLVGRNPIGDGPMPLGGAGVSVA